MHRYREREVAQEVTEVSVLAENGAMPTQMRLLDNRSALCGRHLLLSVLTRWTRTQQEAGGRPRFQYAEEAFFQVGRTQPLWSEEPSCNIRKTQNTDGKRCFTQNKRRRKRRLIPIQMFVVGKVNQI